MKSKNFDSCRGITCLFFILILITPLWINPQTIQDAGEYVKKGYELFKNGNYKESIEYYNKSLAIMENTDRPDMLSKIYMAIGRSYKQLGDKDSAISFFLKSLDAAEKAGDKGMTELMLHFIATDYFETGRNDKAAVYYEKLDTITNDPARKEDAAFFYSFRASELNKSKEYEPAVEYYRKAISIYDKLNKKDRLAECHGLLGAVYDTLEKHRESLEHYLQALAIEENSGSDEKIIKILDNAAWQYAELDDFQSALKYDLRALAMAEKKGDRTDIAKRYLKTGSRYTSLDSTGKAVEYYSRALAIFQETGDRKNEAQCLLNLCVERTKSGEYGAAMDLADKATKIFKSLNDKKGLFGCLAATGEIHHLLGEFDKSVNKYRIAYDIASSWDDKTAIATISSDVGLLYYSWGKYDSAVEWLNKAFAIFGKAEKEYYRNSFQAICLLNTGMAYQAWGKTDKSLECYENALNKFETTGIKSYTALCLNNIGTLYLAQNKPEKAEEFFNRALGIFKESNMQSQMASIMHNTGLIDLTAGRYEDAMKKFTDAIGISEKLGEKSNIASFLDSAGMACLFMKEYDRATGYLKKAIDIKEELRLRTEGELRRDYLASQIRSYQIITSAYLRRGDASAAFESAELASAKYMAELMKSRQKGKGGSQAGTGKFHKKIPANTVLVRFAGVDTPYGMAVFAADKDGVTAKEISPDDCMAAYDSFRKKLSGQMSNDPIKSQTRGMGMKIIKPAGHMKKDIDISIDTSLYEVKYHPVESMVSTYRAMLSDPKSRLSNIRAAGSELYSLLFSQIADRLRDKENIIIIPDGILGFLPFEVLIDRDGKYLADRFNIKYTQSVAVAELIEKRKYAKNRKTCIAFGGAHYDARPSTCDEISSGDQLAMFKQKVNITLRSGNGLGEIYGEMGVCGWDNLPGTLDEVKAIRDLMKGTEIHTGTDASEDTLRKLSDRGKLREFRIIHFATHGLSVPDIPALSAIVLSLNSSAKGNDDGYLVLDDVMSLKINADFVNLSACQTGLGRIYGGEGVVGLSQSFIVAGANGVSVSLWNVNDISTMEFMKDLYGLCTEKKLNFDEAMTEVKRNFIHGKYSHPYYWAPFVYYGK